MPCMYSKFNPRNMFNTRERLIVKYPYQTVVIPGRCASQRWFSRFPGLWGFVIPYTALLMGAGRSWGWF